MLSNFQVTTSVWLPARCTAGFAPSVNTSPVVEQSGVSAVHVATAVYAELLNVPAAPVAFVQVDAFQLTSPAPHVVDPTTGGVNDAAFACSDTRICLVAVARTMFCTITEAAVAAVDELTFVTLNVTPAGTVTLACSLTFAVSVVVWLVSVNVTDCCAKAGELSAISIAPTADTRKRSFPIQECSSDDRRLTWNPQHYRNRHAEAEPGMDRFKISGIRPICGVHYRYCFGTLCDIEVHKCHACNSPHTLAALAASAGLM